MQNTVLVIMPSDQNTAASMCNKVMKADSYMLSYVQVYPDTFSVQGFLRAFRCFFHIATRQSLPSYNNLKLSIIFI